MPSSLRANIVAAVPEHSEPDFTLPEDDIEATEVEDSPEQQSPEEITPAEVFPPVDDATALDDKDMVDVNSTDEGNYLTQQILTLF
jgi:hypothetical protein